ncbi:E3 ubiquitin-protein ligase ZNF598 [Linum perenne]
MDDSCAVCADTLEWVSYGACGHRDVCSTCVARLRFIIQDRRCCICKTESDVVFVTKALGDYTRMINDFSVLPSEPREGRVGSYWYHEDTQAFFDDAEHYKMVKAMCRLSCSRHNTIEHGGRMSRSKRNAALQIPTSFRFHREQDPRRGRGRSSRLNESDNQLSMAIQASLDASFSRSSSHDPPLPSSGTQVADLGDGSNIDPDVGPLESLALTESTPSRYLQALGNSSRNGALQESAFPPLATAPSSSQQKLTQEPEGLPNTTMATHLKRKNKKASAVSSPQGWPTSSGSLSSSSTQWPAINTAPSISHNTFSTPSVSCHASPSVRLLHVPGPSGNLGSTSRMSHSASAPSLAESRLSKPSKSDFPPVSATPVRKTPSIPQVVLNVEDVHTANKSLVEKIRDALEHDEAKYASFKEISGQYRQGSIGTQRYLDNVRQFGLSHLVLELARLCPDPLKQKEMVDTYNASLGSNGRQEKGGGLGIAHLQESKGATKKGKGISTEGSSSKDRLADNIISSVRTLQSQQKPQEEEVEVLSKDGYRNSKGKSSLMADSTSGNGSNLVTRDGSSGNKQKKKTSKFQRARLGDGSMAAILDMRNSEPDPDPGSVGETSEGNGLPMRGVWRKGGSKKLFA